MTQSLIILGTGSDVGKSIVATALCRILRRKGYKVAPFKAQNMSNNSYVTLEGGEIGRAQVAQAEAAGLIPSVDMNPILIKPSTDSGSQIILHGHVFSHMEGIDYGTLKPTLRKAVLQSYQRLARVYDVIVMEGAGSCVEMNLKKTDFVNLPLARAVGAKCILVADIDRGGVFAQIIGSYALMTRKEREMLLGFIINKFRGDPSLFASGIEYIEKKTRKPVLGLVPYFNDIHIDQEDSVVLQRDKRDLQTLRPDTVNIAIITLPAISNFTDFDLLAREPGVVVNYIHRPEELTREYDLLILPGTKNVMEDGLWLARRGWKKAVRSYVNHGGSVLGICGGYQLLGEVVKDPYGVESDINAVKGLGLLPVHTFLEKKKVVRKVTGHCLTNDIGIQGYEIHMGLTKMIGEGCSPFLRIRQIGKKSFWHDGCILDHGRITGTYVHGLLDKPAFRVACLNRFRRKKGIKKRSPKRGRQTRFRHYDRLARHFEAHCNLDRILASF
jgi:adenosylcobyric acid synthase